MTPAVVLRAADVARILEGDPRVAGLEQHLEHALPKIDRGTALPKISPRSAMASYSTVAVFESPAIEVVQVRGVAGARTKSNRRLPLPAS